MKLFFPLNSTFNVSQGFKQQKQTLSISLNVLSFNSAAKPALNHHKPV